MARPTKTLTAIAEDRGLPPFWSEVLTFIYANRDKRDLIITNVVHVSRSNETRWIKYAIIYKGQFLNITWLVAQVLERDINRKHYAVAFHGCGMDMIMHSLILFFSRLIKHGDANSLAAAQWYKTF